MHQDAHDTQQYNEFKKKNKVNAPSLDVMYNNEYEQKIKKVDQELDGEIQHESLKKNLEEQYNNQRVEFVAQDPAMLLNKKNTMPGEKENGYGSYAMTNDVGGAQVDMGQYDDETKPKKKRKKKRKTEAQQPAEIVVDETIPQHDHTNDNLQGHYLNDQNRIPASDTQDETDHTSNNEYPGEEEPPMRKKMSKKKKNQQEPQEYDQPAQVCCYSCLDVIVLIIRIFGLPLITYYTPPNPY